MKKEPKTPPAPKYSSKPSAVKKEVNSPVKGKKKAKDEEAQGDKWKWWEEGTRTDGVKWNFLEHKGIWIWPSVVFICHIYKKKKPNK